MGLGIYPWARLVHALELHYPVLQIIAKRVPISAKRIR
jgi:hypothetical protein